MTVLDLYRSLYAHMAWADAAAWKAVLGSDAARNDPGMRERLHHMHLVQRAFLGIWHGRPFDPRAANPAGLDGLLAWACDYHREVDQFHRALGDVDGLAGPAPARPVCCDQHQPGWPANCFIHSACRRSISSGVRSSLCVAMVHRYPCGSMRVPHRSPQN